MRLLLDTHVLVWAIVAPERLSERVKALLLSSSTERLVSAVCWWDLAQKASVGKLLLPVGLDELARLVREDFRGVPLPLTETHARRLALLPLHHKDPADRLLIAQAQVEGLPVVTRDPLFRRYDIEVVW